MIADDDSARVTPLRADLSIVKATDTEAAVEPGSELAYTLTVTNLGPDAAVDVFVTDTLAPELSYATLPAVEGWACATFVVDAIDEAASTTGFSCTKASPLLVGEQITLAYTVLVAPDAGDGIDLTNEAEVSSNTPDPDLTNNRDDATTLTVVPPPPPTPPTGIEYPGPFSDPVEPEDEPDEVLELVITGSSSRLLVLLSTLMLMFGGVLQVAGRRRRGEQD